MATQPNVVRAAGLGLDFASEIWPSWAGVGGAVGVVTFFKVTSSKSSWVCCFVCDGSHQQGMISEVRPFLCSPLCRNSSVVELGTGARPHRGAAGTRPWRLYFVDGLSADTRR